jgi:hypothetical protein
LRETSGDGTIAGANEACPRPKGAAVSAACRLGDLVGVFLRFQHVLSVMSKPDD